MSHYHLEIIMPPVADVKKAVEEILAPFNEQGEDEDGNPNCHTFWDWWVIGGRWAGHHFKAALDPVKLEEFNQKLTEMKITISGIQFGKQELSPASQIPVVDKLWREFFPESPAKSCPIFKHYNDQYEHEGSPGDIIKLSEMSPNLNAHALIIAAPQYDDATKMEAKHMQQCELWNGCSWVETKFNGNIKTAVDEYKKSVESYAPEAVAKYMPTDGWLVVTVDYHS